jgi:hypothetical protein
MHVVRKLFFSILVSLMVVGCGAVDSMKEGFKHSQEVASDLEKSVGEPPFVGFNWMNGSLTNVSVTFKGVPAGKTNQEIISLARTSIAARFKQQPEQIVISFAVSGRES